MKIVVTALILGTLASCDRKQPENVHWISDSNSIASAIEIYRGTTGDVPTNEQGLDALRERPLSLTSSKPWTQVTSKSFVDSWGKPYRYKVITNFGNTQFEIRSYGADGIVSEDDLIATYPELVHPNQDNGK